MPCVPAAAPRRPVLRSLRIIAAVCAVVALAVTAAACGSSAASATKRDRVEKPDVTVAVVPATSVAGLYIAQQRGYFAQAGLHVKIVPVASGVNALPELVRGSVDVDEGQWTSDVAAEAAGAARLRVLAPGNSGGIALEQVVVPPGSPVTTVGQLRGKTIAVNALKGLAVLLTSNVLNSYGVNPASVHFVVIPFPAMAAALTAHRVDAAFMTEPFLSGAEEANGVVPLFDIDQGAAHDFPIAGYVTSQIPGHARRVRRGPGPRPASGSDQPPGRPAGHDREPARVQGHGGDDGAGDLPAGHDRQRPGPGGHADEAQRPAPRQDERHGAGQGDDHRWPLTCRWPARRL
jgi:NMT1/THI5 like protein